MYHWRVVTISRGLSPFSKNFTGWVICLISPSRSPDSRSNSAIRSFAVKAVAPERCSYAARPLSEVIQSGTPGRMRPSHPMIGLVGNWSSRHQVTSVVSPNVQIIAMPEPFSGSASSWATTGTSTPNTGVVTVCPKSGW